MHTPAPLTGPASDGSYPRPTYVMFGIDNPAGGVVLFASGDLVQASLEKQARDLFPLIPGFSIPAAPEVRTTLFVEMREFVMVYAATHGEALRKLMGDWEPPEVQRALPAPDSRKPRGGPGG
jgi:hypothetical protein